MENLTKDNIKNIASEIKEAVIASLKDKTEIVKDKAEDMQNYVSGYVKDNPMKSLGMGALVGMLVVALFKRK